MLESLSNEELQFVKAIEKYKQKQGKLFLSWTEVLKILKELGYRKIASKERKEKERGGKEAAARPKEA